jgi:cytochrome c556
MQIVRIALSGALIGWVATALAADPAAPPPSAPAPAAPPAAAPPAAAPPADPARVVEYRKTAMEAAGKHMKATNLVLSGAVPRPQDLQGHATALHDLGVGFVDLFPAGTEHGKHKTEAKAEIWSKADLFKAAAATYSTETQKLVEVSKSGDLAAFKAQYEAVGKSCKGCHDGFRAKD